MPTPAYPSVDGSTYGTDIGCGECHNDVRTGGQAAVKAKWKARTCEACHAVGTDAAMHGVKTAGLAKATDSAGCAESGTGCHDTADLHAHASRRAEEVLGLGERGRAGLPRPQGRGAQAADDLVRQRGRERDVPRRLRARPARATSTTRAVHAPTTSIPAADTSYYDTPCGGCHLMARRRHEPHGRARARHVREDRTSPTTPAATATTTRPRPRRSRTTGARRTPRTRAGRVTAPRGSTPCTQAASPQSIRSTMAARAAHRPVLAAIRPPTSPTSPRRPSTAACTRAVSGATTRGSPTATSPTTPRRPRAATAATATTAATTPRPPATSSKAARMGGTDAKHTAGAAQRGDMYWDDASGIGTSCGVCHDMALGTEHARPNSPMPAGKSGCLTCHNKNLGTATVVKASWSAKCRQPRVRGVPRRRLRADGRTARSPRCTRRPRSAPTTPRPRPRASRAAATAAPTSARSTAAWAARSTAATARTATSAATAS